MASLTTRPIFLQVAGLALTAAFLATAPIPTQAQDGEQAGVSAAVTGEVLLARGNAVGQQVESGEAIFLGDAITSQPASNLQILLMDESVFTIGPDSAVTIDRFVYDPATQTGEITASMAKGVMRFVTGKIASGQPENMQIELPVGTIGIRGTIGVVQMLDPEDARTTFPDQYNELTGGGGGQTGGQPVVFAALVGPGGNNDANANVGAFNFSSPDGSVDLNRPGGSVLATPGAPPVFFIAPPGAIQNLNQQISGGATGTGEGQYEDEQDTEGGQDDGTVNPQQAEGSGNGQPTATGTVVDDLDQAIETGEEGQSATDSSGFANAGTSFGVTLQEVVAANSGSATGSEPINGTIEGTFSYSIDFSNRTFDMQANNLEGGGLSSNNVRLANQPRNLPSGTQQAITIGSGGDFASEVVTGQCVNCLLTVRFPTTGTMNAQVQHKPDSIGPTGSTGEFQF